MIVARVKALLIDKNLPEWFVVALQARGIESTALSPPLRQWPDLSDYEVVLVRGAVSFTGEKIKQASKLRYVLRPGSGIELIDRAALARRGVVLINSPEGNAPTVAEHALALILSLIRGLPEDIQAINGRLWRRTAVGRKELSELTVGIIGFGHAGRELARRIVPLARKVKVYDRFRPPGFASEVPGIEEADYDDLMRAADVLSVHVDMRPENFHWIDDDFFGAMQKGAYLVNTSRGQVVDSAALLRALQQRRLGGLALDVLENEPPEPDVIRQLQQFPNVIITPHIAGWSETSHHRIYSVLLKKLDALLEKRN